MNNDNSFLLSWNKNDLLKKTTSSTLPSEHPARLCNNEQCNKLASVICPRCKIWKYCSHDCEESDRPYHHKECQIFGRPDYKPQPTAATHTNYLDRPAVHKSQILTKAPMKIACNVIMRLYSEWNFRIGYFGAARMGKVVIFLKNADDCETLVAALHSPAFKAYYQISHAVNPAVFGESVEVIIQGYHERQSAAKRKEIADEFHKEDSKIRILVVSPETDVDIIAPDVEVVICMLVPSGTEVLANMFQRVAMKAGMSGELLQLMPESLDPNGDKAKGWQPIDWR